MPDEGSFSELLNRYVDDFSDAFGLPADFFCEVDLPPLEPAVQAELMRIAQESLNNARRHSGAQLIRVEVGMENNQLRLAIIDNGRGFDMRAIRKGAFGLASMRERALLIGGQLEIKSRPEHGTRVSIVLPVPAGTRSPS
jgi:two-component system sensor histidine kinase UhpB